MASRAPEAAIDRLYQLPLEEFTSARNALAKESGADAARIRALAKPPMAAWAINQLYWRERDVWDSLVAAAENARRAHKAVLSGREADVRAASEVHEGAVDAALKTTLAMLTESGHPATDATKHAIATTLRALPGDEPPGRLTRTLQPGGFEMLAGLSVGSRATTASSAPAKKPAPGRAEHAAKSSAGKADAKTLTRAREAAASASRALREAEQAVRREEFEAARTARDEERAADAVKQAREALARAKADLEEAEAAATVATRRHEDAESRAREAKQALTAARSRADAATRDLEKLEKSHG